MLIWASIRVDVGLAIDCVGSDRGICPVDWWITFSAIPFPSAQDSQFYRIMSPATREWCVDSI